MQPHSRPLSLGDMSVFAVTLGIVFILVMVPIAFWALQALFRGARRAGHIGTRKAR